MAKKIEITEAQLEAIKRMADTLSAMTGCCDEDSDFDKNVNHDVNHDVRLVDKMLKNNKLAPRKFS